MQKPLVNYLTISFFLLVYINRGVFITPYEVANPGNQETNSLIEWIIQLITGESNNIDEDGDSQTDCNSVKVVHYDFSQQFTQSLELANLISKDVAKNRFPYTEKFSISDFYSQIDHPPQRII